MPRAVLKEPPTHVQGMVRVGETPVLFVLRPLTPLCNLINHSSVPQVPTFHYPKWISQVIS